MEQVGLQQSLFSCLQTAVLWWEGIFFLQKSERDDDKGRGKKKKKKNPL